jgi:glycosyltransferase involved in cell wall biosynthesis
VEFDNSFLMIKASIIITTKNRKEELRGALLSSVAQSARPEVIVIDDGSTDGTAQMVRAEFPQVALHRFKESKGLVVRRNEGARLAQGEIIFSIDDDAVFTSRHTVEQTLGEFDCPRVGAVAIPYVEPHKSSVTLQQGPPGKTVFVKDAFIGTAHAVRKDLFLRLGGYREFLVQQGEEMDFCIRMLTAVFVVRLGRADVIHHFESPRRDYRRMNFYGRRNDILFVWHYVPWPYFPFHLAGAILNGLISTGRSGRPASMLRGAASGFMACMRRWSERQPVSPVVYALNRSLKKRGPLPLHQIEAQLAGWKKTNAALPQKHFVAP